MENYKQVVKADGGVSTNPRSCHWRDFLAACRAEAERLYQENLESADEEGERDAAEAANEDVNDALDEAAGDLDVAETCAVEVGTKAKTELRTMLDVAYQSGVQQGAAAIVAALEASVVDGPQDQHPSRAQLEGQADSNSTWTNLRNSWNF